MGSGLAAEPAPDLIRGGAPERPDANLLSPDSRHRLEHRAYRGGVVAAVAVRHRGRIDRAGRAEQRRGAAELAREIAADRHVLLPRLAPPGDIVPVLTPYRHH